MLTEMQVRNAKGRDKDYKLADSDGLYLFVTAKGHRSWRMKYRFAGRERRLVLGAYPELSLRDEAGHGQVCTEHGEGNPARRSGAGSRPKGGNSVRMSAGCSA